MELMVQLRRWLGCRRSLAKNPFLSHNEPEEPRWAVLWTNPLYTMEDGTSVQYECELEVIGEAG